MSELKSTNKEKVQIGVVSGLVYALLMAAYYYFNNQDFSLKKFALNFLIFGVLMGVFLPMVRKKRKS